MPYPHPIRLRGPWQFEPLCSYVRIWDGQVAESRENLPESGRATVPGDWGTALGSDFRGRVRYRRAFHAPAILDAHERLWLVIEGVDARGIASVNGVRLGEIEGYAIESSFDITTLIAPSNEVALEVELPLGVPSADRPLRPGREGLPGGPIREVRLEVRSQWFIDGLAVWNRAEDGTFIATGSVAGEASPMPLAVVVSGCQRELAYFEALPDEKFEFEFSAEDFSAWSRERPNRAALEVKLIGGSSSVWQKQIETAVRTPIASEGVRVVTEILADGNYQEFDRAGLAIIQQVPLVWVSRVCPRLAHHPSIVAWTASPDPPPPEPFCGRHWIP